MCNSVYLVTSYGKERKLSLVIKFILAHETWFLHKPSHINLILTAQICKWFDNLAIHGGIRERHIRWELWWCLSSSSTQRSYEWLAQKMQGQRRQLSHLMCFYIDPNSQNNHFSEVLNSFAIWLYYAEIRWENSWVFIDPTKEWS